MTVGRKNKRRIRAGLLLGALAYCIASSAAAAPVPAPAEARAVKAEDGRLNVLLIISDDLNTRLGTYGAPVITPNIDRLARQGVRFDRAYSQFPWCAPSRASFLTGLRPDTTGVKDRQTPLRAAVPDLVTLPQYFRQHGYVTARVGKVFHQGVPGDIGTDGADDALSWTQVSNPRGRDKDAEAGRLLNRTPGIGWGSALAFLSDEGSGEQQTDGMVASETIRMLQAHRDRPFFIAAGFYRPHVPLVAPSRYFDLYAAPALRLAAETPQTLAAVSPVTRNWLPDNFGMTESEQREVIQGYYASTSFMDAQVGRILDALRDLGLEDDTLVVFVSDHGLLLGEHGQWLKNVLWDDATRVPLVVRVPGMRGNGRSSSRTVELVDLFPTVVEAAGLPEKTGLEGRSLMPLLRNPTDRRWTKPARSQVKGGRSVTTERWRYTEWEGGKAGRELYDHARDPLEHRNLAELPEFARVIARLKPSLPQGESEARPPAIAYRPDRDCLQLPATAGSRAGVRCAGDD